MRAFLNKLRRNASGDFTLEQARTISELEATSARRPPGRRPHPQRAASSGPSPNEIVDALTAVQIRQGRDFRVSPFRVRPSTRYVKALTQQGELVAIGQIETAQRLPPVPRALTPRAAVFAQSVDG